MTDYIYDIESLSKCFTLTALSAESEKTYVFEVSPRKNDWKRLRKFLKHIKDTDSRMIGFNNVGYDYPVLHKLLQLNANVTARTIVGTACRQTKKIISTPFDKRFSNQVKPSERYTEQVDLMMINHYDNVAKATSLKMLEFVMRMDNISEFDMNNFTVDQIDELLAYNLHDVKATYQFYLQCKPQIDFRSVLSEQYGYDMTNFNDTKIGEWVLIKALETEILDDICYYYQDGKRKMRQSHRKQISFDEILFDYLEFDRPEFQAIHRWMSNQVIFETKGVFSDIPVSMAESLAPYVKTIKKSRKHGCDVIPSLNCVVNDFEFVFGVGGIHGSVESGAFYGGYGADDEDYVIIDCDVTSLYPSIAIQNSLYPEHLTNKFCDIYHDMLDQRMTHAKGTPENAMLKLGLNGAYGKSNSVYSPLYDPKFTMSITINGQLSLLMLCEKLMEIDELQIIQVNTDGVTAILPCPKEEQYYKVCKEWEQKTKLILEYVEYSEMFVRDVNNYVGVYQKEMNNEVVKVKRKGAYEYARQPHQNQSALVVPKCAEQVLINRVDPLEFLKSHDDLFDFCLRTKVPKTSRLEGIDAFGDLTEMQRITRYFVSNDGLRLDKVMPPLPEKPGVERHISIEKGFHVSDVSMWRDFDKSEINYDYYLAEVKKLTDKFVLE